MALTQTDLDVLDAAIATGALEVEFDGRRVKYQHTDAMVKARNHVATIVNGGTNRGPGVLRFRFTTTRGE